MNTFQIKQYLKEFFKPKKLEYLYDSPMDEVLFKLDEIFNRNYNVFDSNNIDGEFIDKTKFNISINYRVKKFVGQVLEIENNQTKIILVPQNSIRLNMSFYSLLIIGVFIFINFLYLGSITNLFFSIISVIIGLTFIVGTSIIHSESIKENYLKHIDKILKS
jgi:hypothetical protein